VTYLGIAVLVVEDEALIRLNISDELTELGFEVFEAANAGEAVELLKRHREIHVLFTDIDMPGDVDGLQLAQLVRTRWPPIKIIVTSGKHSYSHDELPVEGRFIPKPYDTAFVAAAIQDVMRL
jgi:CheY-like chemotaxis protein